MDAYKNARKKGVFAILTNRLRSDIIKGAS